MAPWKFDNVQIIDLSAQIVDRNSSKRRKSLLQRSQLVENVEPREGHEKLEQTSKGYDGAQDIRIGT